MLCRWTTPLASLNNPAPPVTVKSVSWKVMNGPCKVITNKLRDVILQGWIVDPSSHKPYCNDDLCLKAIQAWNCHDEIVLSCRQRGRVWIPALRCAPDHPCKTYTWLHTDQGRRVRDSCPGHCPGLESLALPLWDQQWFPIWELRIHHTAVAERIIRSVHWTDLLSESWNLKSLLWLLSMCVACHYAFCNRNFDHVWYPKACCIG